MFTVRMITKKDTNDEMVTIPKGSIIYEEEFNNLNEVDTDGFIGQDYRVEIIHNENQSVIIVEN